MSVFSSQTVRPPPDLHTDAPVIALPLKFFRLSLSSEIRASLGKKFIFLKSSLKGLSTLLISFSFEELEFSTIFTHFGDQAYNRIMATNNRTMSLRTSIVVSQ